MPAICSPARANGNTATPPVAPSPITATSTGLSVVAITYTERPKQSGGKEQVLRPWPASVRRRRGGGRDSGLNPIRRRLHCRRSRGRRTCLPGSNVARGSRTAFLAAAPPRCFRQLLSKSDRASPLQARPVERPECVARRHSRLPTLPGTALFRLRSDPPAHDRYKSAHGLPLRPVQVHRWG